jgi:hypothetical protein
MKRKTFLKALTLALCVIFAGSWANAETWKFGIMSDTQWKADLDGENPNTVAAGIIKQLNKKFIDSGVAFVIQVGDLTDKGDNVGAMETRAEVAKELYDSGIGFYPLRGNHESSQAAALKFQTLYPQTIGMGSNVYGASNFSSPFDTLKGLSYSFDYKNARFVLLDQFTRTDGTNNNNTSNDNIIDQQAWIDVQLAAKGMESHGFVFSHKNLIGANHVDFILGSDPAKNPDAQNDFFLSLQNNGVRYEFGGHDHNHLRSLVVSPDGQSTVQNIITSSNSYKFYTPKIPSIDEQYNLPAFGFLRETPISQELYTVGYYIVTVDGPRVTVEHFASNNGCGGTLGNGQDCDLTVTPDLTFSKREPFGYSLNGQEFQIGQGEPYTIIEDEFEGTTAKILNGVNESVATIYDGRPTIKDVNTGWTPKSEVEKGDSKSSSKQTFASNILTLWGMADLGTDQTDTYVISMSYDKTPTHLGNGALGIASKDKDDNWVNAVDMNFGANKKFVHGPWKANYKLGTYGVDPASKTAWAVINYNGEFAVARNIEPVPGHNR